MDFISIKNFVLDVSILLALIVIAAENSQTEIIGLLGFIVCLIVTYGYSVVISILSKIIYLSSETEDIIKRSLIAWLGSCLYYFCKMVYFNLL